MKNTIKKIALFIIAIVISLSGYSQNDMWIKSTKKISNEQKVRRKSEPVKAQFYELDLSLLKTLLIGAPIKGTFTGQSKLILSFPNADGIMEKFSVMEAPIMHPDLEAKFPMIKTYAAQGITDPTATMRFSITPFGLHSMVLSGKNNTCYIDPYSIDQTTYIVYSKTALGKNPELFECLINDEVNPSHLTNNAVNKINNTNDQKLRTYRLALACNAEYGNLFAGTGTLTQQKTNIQAQMTITMNRVNGVYERDFAITMVFVPNNDLLIYLGNTSADPWTNEFNTTTAQTIDAAIGIINYDIGHNFNTSGGGNAGCIACVCQGNSSSQAGTHKGRGMTGQTNPTGDPFDIDYVAHEMGHQFGGYHVMNTCSRSGSGLSEVEPASGSSIMGYAGICSSNIQLNSDADFNYVNVRDISLNVQSGNSTCAQITNLTNNPPTANAGNDYTIPKSTAYILEGTANDVDGIASLTYNWSQNDPDQSPGNAAPLATYAIGPLYRSISPTISPNRWMPDITTVLSNTLSSMWEVTPSVARTMNFSFIVRDNDVNGGQTASDLMKVTVDGGSGPFIITTQNTSATWDAGTPETITWNVANTSAVPVNATNVNIYLSIDGGLTYPITLASNVPNNGSAIINVPSVTTTQARVMVRGAGNIFYDINDTNITIQQTAFVMSTIATNTAICPPNSASYTFTYNTYLSFTENTVFSVNGLPAGATAVFNPTIAVNDGTVVNLTINGITSAMAGSYNLLILGTATTVTKSTNVVLNILSTALNAPTLVSPANGDVGILSNTNLTWNPTAGTGNTYHIQIATDSNFSNIIDNAVNLVNTTYSTSSLQASTTCYWRVIVSNPCTSSVYSTTYSFTTNSCLFLSSANVPVSISPTTISIVTSTLMIAAPGILTDVNVINLIGTHSYISDLTISLTSPAGTKINLFSGVCGSNANFNLNFDDAAPSSAIACPATTGATYKSLNPLITLNGEMAAGIWTLTVKDNYSADGGSLNSWGLSLCTTTNASGIKTYSSLNALSIYPNPTNGIVSIMVKSSANENVTYKLTNAIGQLIEAKTILPNQKWQLNLESYSCGVYYISVQSKDEIITEKIIFQKQ